MNTMHQEPTTQSATTKEPNVIKNDNQADPAKNTDQTAGHRYEALFTPFKIGHCEIRNRIIIPAMEGTNIVENMYGPKYNQKACDYYIERAKNNVGLFIPGMIPVFSMMRGKWLHKSPKVFEAARPLIEDIHKNGAKIFFQIGAGFAGRNYTLPMQMLKIAGSPFLKKITNPILRLNDMMVAPDEGQPLIWAPQFKTRAITKAEIENYIEGYAKSAKLCKEIGVDGVEVHAVHEGYLMDQFTTKYTNHREDEYGGSFENRYRFAVEVVKAIKRECGDDYPVMLRYSVESKVIDFKVGAVPGEEFEEKGRDMAESERAAKYLQDAGYDALNCDNGTYDSWYWAHPPAYMPLNTNLQEAEHISRFVTIPVLVAGKMQAKAAEESIKAGKIDAVAIGRQLLCDGEYITKLQTGREQDIRPCIACHNACLPVSYYANSGAAMDMHDALTQGHCALNPVAFEEQKYAIVPTQEPKQITVIGGGIAGMQVALLLSERGHEVDLYEKTDQLGGVFIAAAAPGFKEKDRELLAWYRRNIAQSNVRVHLNTEIHDLTKTPGDLFVIATGGTARRLSIPGFEKGIEAISYLNGSQEVGDKVVVIGGGLTGCEIAYDLILKGKQPIVVEQLDDLVKAIGICAANSSCLKDLLRYHKVPVYLKSTVKEIGENYVKIQTPEGEKTITCDDVILSVGYISDQGLLSEQQRAAYKELAKRKKKDIRKMSLPGNTSKSAPIYVLGDASEVGNLKKVIWSAYDLGVSL